MKKLIKKFMGAEAAFGFTGSMFVSQVLADDISDPVLKGMQNSTDDTFSELENKIVDIGGGLFNLGQTSGKVILVLSIIFCGICCMLYRSPMRQDTNKSAVINALIGAFMVFAVLGIVGIILGILS